MLLLFSDIMPVSGYLRSILIDVSRGKYYLIPNLWYALIVKYNGLITLETINETYSKKFRNQTEELLSFLNSNELIFSVDKSIANQFPEISDNYEYPFDFQNIVIQLSNQNIGLIQDCISNNVFSKIKNLAFVLEKDVEIVRFINLLRFLYSTGLYHCEIRIHSTNRNVEKTESHRWVTLELRIL